MDVIESLKLRPGMPCDDILNDIITDCTQDLKDMLHTENVNGCDSILKELALIKINHDGADGISSESHSGISTSYLDDLPKSLRRKIDAKRKLPR